MPRLMFLLFGLLLIVNPISASEKPGTEVAQSPSESELGPCDSKFQPLAKKADALFQAGKYDFAIAEFKKCLEQFRNVPYFNEPLCYLDYVLYFKTSLMSAYLYKEDAQSLAHAKDLTIETLPAFALPSALEFAERRVEFKQLATTVAYEIHMDDTDSAKSILRQLLTLPVEPADALEDGAVTDAYLHYYLGYLAAEEAKKPTVWQEITSQTRTAIRRINQVPADFRTELFWDAYVEFTSLLSLAYYLQDDVKAAIQTLDHTVSLVSERPASEDKVLDSAQLRLEKSATLLELGKFSDVIKLLENVSASLEDLISSQDDIALEMHLITQYQKLEVFKFQGRTAEEEELKKRLRLLIPEENKAFDLLSWNTRLYYFIDRYNEAVNIAAGGNCADAVEALELIKQDFKERMIPTLLREQTYLRFFLMDCTLVQFGLCGDNKFKTELDQYYEWCTARPADINAQIACASYLLIVKHDASGIEQYNKAGFPNTVYAWDSWLSSVRDANSPDLTDTEELIVRKLKALGVVDSYIESIR